MKRLFFLLLLFPCLVFSQKSYFQQEVNYRISVVLDDRNHTLTGAIAIDYLNNSPDALPEIWMHCWPNAYASRHSAFCQQKLRQQDTEFYFAADSSLGGLEKLDFQVNGQKVTWAFDPKNSDIARLQLAKPLAPGARLTITTPFVLKIPASFSRLGHVGQSYQITQWFPKPAVYDPRGWHPIPYLDQGEFYSEFGSFDVSITLPANYVVGATGTLQTTGELDFLNQKEAETRAKMSQADLPGKKKRPTGHPFPPSLAVTKTLRFTTEKVHDFAWFADKRFNVLHDTARLASGRTVDCWAMFTDENFRLWQKGAFYVRRAVEFYSENVGEYPWPQATAVHSALSAGGGMEYPMITVIGNSSDAASLDEVITHEVGHNWFYGILASNERDHPWMDEGMNSYYEMRYMKKYYGGSTVDNAIPKQLYNPKSNGPLLLTGYTLLARNHDDTPPDSPSDRFLPAAYGLEVYMKTALAMAWLEKAVGTASFDKAMQAYFRDWQFRHPYPEDARESWRAAGMDADWFFQAMQTGKQTDYALKKVEKVAGGYRLTIRNKGELNAPFPVTALNDGQPMGTQWYPAPAGKTETVVFAAQNADDFVIDRDFNTLDVRRQNNGRRKTFGIEGFAPLEKPLQRTLGVLPWLGWNNYDKTMVGLVFYNPPFPGQRLQYYLAPGFGIGSKQVVGLADVRYNMYPGGIFPKMTLGVSAKSFQYDYLWGEADYWRFYRVVPQLRAELRSGSLSFRHWLNLRVLFIGRDGAGISPTDGYVKANYKSTIYEARYEAAQKKSPNPFQFAAALEWQNNEGTPFQIDRKYLRGTVEYQQRFYYSEKRKITARVFVGAFLQNTARRTGRYLPETLTLLPHGYNDYRFDQVFLGRSENEGIFSQQLSQSDGGFKNAIGASYPYVAQSNNFVAALNLRADLPFRLPLGLPVKPYFDLGYYDDATPVGPERSGDQFLWSGGLLLQFFGGGFEVYFPLVNAKPLDDLYKDRGGYGARITWSLRLNRVTPNDIANNLLH